MPTAREDLNLKIKNAQENALRIVRQINKFPTELDSYSGLTKESLELDLVDLYQQLYMVNKLTDELYDELIALDSAKPSLIKRIFRRQ